MTNPFDSGYFHSNELVKLGFRAVGKNVAIAKNNTIVGLENIRIGDNVRIDGYCTLLAIDGNLAVGSNVHIGGYSYISAGEGVSLGNFANLSQGVRIYSRSDNYDGSTLTNPTIPPSYTRPVRGPVTVGKHVIIGSGAIILPNITIGEGCAIGALSLINCSLESWGIYSGIPAKRIKDRKKDLLNEEVLFLRDNT